jgi:hypothetical protein
MDDHIVAYLLHARTAEPQKQPFLSITRTQQYKYNNEIISILSEAVPSTASSYNFK